MRMRLGEMWLSVPCGTFCKLGVINGEHQFRDKGDPQRKPIQGTEKGEKAEEDDALMQKALQLVEFLARKKAEQLQTGEMMEVEGSRSTSGAWSGSWRTQWACWPCRTTCRTSWRSSSAREA